MALDSELFITLDSTLFESSDIELPRSVIAFVKQYIWPNGSGADKANIMFTDIRTLSGSSVEIIDFLGGLTSSLNTVLNLVAVKTLIIRSFPGNTGTLTFGPHSVNGFTAIVNDVSDRIVVRPGGLAVLVAPNAVGYFVDATRRNLIITNTSTASSTYDFIVVGETS